MRLPPRPAPGRSNDEFAEQRTSYKTVSTPTAQQQRAGPASLRQFFSDLDQPVASWPIAWLRRGTGAVCLLWLARIGLESDVFWSAQGVMPHELVAEAFPYAWQPLLWPQMSAFQVQFVAALAALPALALALGHGGRRSAFALFLVSVCLYRFNFLLCYVDDMVVNLMLFWCWVLPASPSANPQTAPAVPGRAARMFLVNISLLYGVAGLAKWQSPLWRAGGALFAIDQLPISWFPGPVPPPYPELWRWLAWLALGIEPLFALLPWLPASRARSGLALALVAFHGYNVVCLDVGFANALCLVAAPLVLWHRAPQVDVKVGKVDLWTGRLAVAVAALLAVTTLSSLVQGQWRQPRAGPVPTEPTLVSAELGSHLQLAATAGLWFVGLAQSYRLLDWIDERNFRGTLAVFGGALRDQPLLAGRLMPQGMRPALTASYLAGVTWTPVPVALQDKLRAGLRARLLARACRVYPDVEAVRVEFTLQRVWLGGDEPPRRLTLADGNCPSGRP